MAHVPVHMHTLTAQGGGISRGAKHVPMRSADNYTQEKWGKLRSMSYSLFSVILRFLYEMIRKKAEYSHQNFLSSGSSTWKIYRRKRHQRMHRVLEMLSHVGKILEGSFKCPTWCNKNPNKVHPKLCILHLTKDTATDKYQNRFVNAALLAAKNRSL